MALNEWWPHKDAFSIQTNHFHIQNKHNQPPLTYITGITRWQYRRMHAELLLTNATIPFSRHILMDDIRCTERISKLHHRKAHVP